MVATYLPIIVTSLFCGLAAGFVMHRADFCTTAMFRDPFLFGDFFVLRMLALLVATSMVLFEAGRLLGLLPYPFPLLPQPTLATLIGGAIFGVGMVLAGGCVVGTLYKLGAGSLASGLAFLGMLAGSAAYAEFHPAWAKFAEGLRLTRQDALTLPRWLGVAPTWLVLPIALLGAAWLFQKYRAGELTRPSFSAGHIPPWKAALILAGIGFASYALVGMPLGITTSYSKLGAKVESLVAPEHVAANPYFNAQPLRYTPPLAAEPITGGPGPELDGVAAIQYPLILGIIFGAMYSARRAGELRWHGRIPPRQLASALIGGLLLGVAARMAPSCNVWHLWGGVPILASSSLLFLAGLVPGAWLGTRLLTRWVIR